MKSVEIRDATGILADYAREAQHETLVVTRRGKPMAAVVPLRGIDLESLAVSTNPDFIALIERARARYRQTGGISLEDMKRKWGTAKPVRKTKRRPARRAAPTARRSSSR
jgi:prevent-host-death family protein